MFIVESYSVVTDSCHDTIQHAVCFVLCLVFQYLSACLPPYQPFFVGRDNEECSGSSGISLAIELDALLLQVAGATVWEGVADLFRVGGRCRFVGWPYNCGSKCLAAQLGNGNDQRCHRLWLR